MTRKNNQDLILRVEEKIKSAWDANQHSQLNQLPFADFEEIIAAYNNNTISIGVENKSDLLNIFLTNKERNILLIYSWVPFIIIIIDIILGFTYTPTIFIGALIALIGWIISSPFVPIRQFVAGASLISFIASLFLYNWDVIIIIGSLLFSLMAGISTRDYQRDIVIERAMSSKIIFDYLYSTKLLYVRINK